MDDDAKRDTNARHSPDAAMPQGGISRRGLFQGGAAAAATGALVGLGVRPAAAADAKAAQPMPAQRSAPLDRPYNMVLIITDEESYRIRPAEGFTTPARSELQNRGTTFHNHYIGAAMCTPSRGVMFSGQPPQVNGVYDQMELGYVPSLSPERPSMGTIFKKLGYETAYYGKFELRRDIIKPNPHVNYTDALRAYGFDSFAADGDKTGGPDQGYDSDPYTAGEAIRWLRTRAQSLDAAGQPWLLVVSFVSPHDIMYALTNQPGSQQQASQVGMPLNPPPANSRFARQWTFPPSPSHRQSMDSPGRPLAHLTYKIGWSAFLGEIPADAPKMWRDYYNYYLNLIRDNDDTLQTVLDTLTDLDLWDSTVVMRTADHGELAGSHGGLRGKGPLPYEEETHVPMVVVHPEHGGGRACQALTSHIDLLPTMVGLTGAATVGAAATRPDPVDGLPGRDFSPVLADPGTAAVDAVREGVLFNYVGLQTVDSLYMMRVCRDVAEGRPAPPFAEARPDMTRRGFISFVFDGRYKYSRYYAPDDFNTPITMAEILAHNALELFDLETDPDEMNNLAAEPEQHEALILRLNALLNELIAREVGVNDGAFLPRVLRRG